MCGEGTKWKQNFYDDVEAIKLKEPLAEFLGAIDKGAEFVFTYTDAVKLAGHSCSSVAAAYKITQKALGALYPDEIPVRGQVSVRILGSVDDAANGPMSQVFGLITGAAGQNGFKGLGLRFARKDKLLFDESALEPHAFVFSRDDNHRSVKVTYYPQKLPVKSQMQELLTKSIVGTATKKQEEEFQKMWQERVRAVLLEEVKGLFRLEVLN